MDEQEQRILDVPEIELFPQQQQLQQPALKQPLIWVERGTEEHRRLIQEYREEEMRNEWVTRGLPLDEFTVDGLEEIWEREQYVPEFFLDDEVHSRVK